ncbi:MAG: hypothetical protein ABS935_03050 [Solibacillus sp.]|uniref:hypothetical protein n=1 Tax=Solibacillus sp. TaxID=1909654 RepID=UPI003315E62E
MPKYEYKGRVINATERAYELLYKGRGFKPYEENPVVDLSKLDPVTLDNEYTIPALKKYLDGKSIKYKSNDSKDELIALIIGDEGEPDGAKGTEDSAATAGE